MRRAFIYRGATQYTGSYRVMVYICCDVLITGTGNHYYVQCARAPVRVHASVRPTSTVENVPVLAQILVLPVVSMAIINESEELCTRLQSNESN